MSWLELLLVFLGFAVGAYGALVGVGGGFILVPALLLIYPDDTQKALTSISLAVVLATSASSTIAFARRRIVDYQTGLMFAAAAVPSALAALSIGASPLRIVVRHISVNTVPPILVQASLSVAIAIIIEATLGFIGLSVRPPTPTIGSILNDGRAFLTVGAWYLILFPTILLSLVILSLNFLSDALLEATGPLRSSTKG